MKYLQGHFLDVAAAQPVVFVLQAKHEISQNPDPYLQVTGKTMGVKDAARRN